MRKVIIIAAILGMLSSASFGDNLDMSKFVGLWKVNFERTMEEAKKSPKYREEDAERMPAMIKRMMAKMKIEISDKDMSYIRGANKMTLPYTFTSSDTKSATVNVKQGPKEASMVFYLIDGEFMNFKSSASDDMHFYIWEKEEK